MTIFILIFIIIYTMSYYESNPKCPPFLNEIKPIYAQQGTKEYNEWFAKQRPVSFYRDNNGKITYVIMATTSIDLLTGENLGTKIGAKPNLKAIEHNKKVKECLVDEK